MLLKCENFLFIETRIKEASRLHFLSADTVSMSCCYTLYLWRWVYQWASQVAKKQLTLVGLLASDVSWPINIWYKLANMQLTLVAQWGTDVKWSMRSWHWLAKKQLTPVGHKASDISWVMSSWCKLNNEKLTLVGHWANDINSIMSRWHINMPLGS